MVQSRPAPKRAHPGTQTTWKTQILRAAILGIMPFVGACAGNKQETVKQSHQLVGGSQLERPIVLSGNPSRDTIVHSASDEPLTEAEWNVLEALAPKAIWERIAEMSKSKKDRQGTADAARESATRP